jgi:tellurite resistance protein TerC
MICAGEHHRDVAGGAGCAHILVIGCYNHGVGDLQGHDALIDSDHEGFASEEAKWLAGKPCRAEARRDHREDRHKPVNRGVVAAKFTPIKIPGSAAEGKQVARRYFQRFGMPTSWWIGFNTLVLLLLALDLGVFNRKAHAVSVREALGWSAVWVTLAIGFGGWIGLEMGRASMLEFYAGYLVEQALSVDNLFVFILIFGYFRIAPELQHRVLFWGILGALLMRGAMIGAGAVLIERFHAIIYVFGAFLVYTGIKMAFGGDSEIEPEANPVIKFVRKVLPVSSHFHGERFFIREAGPGGVMRRTATPLFVVLMLVETTDVVFALDSIPAIFGVTRNPFLVYTSNVFAILGLRSMYFVLASVIGKFHLLKYGLSVVLAFVGVKMLLSEKFPISIGVSLGVVAGVLLTSVLLSLVIKPSEEIEELAEIADTFVEHEPE